MYVIYGFLTYLFFLITSPYFIYKLLTTKKYRAGIKERLGFLGRRFKEMKPGKRRIWIHAVSVGEVIAASLLIKRIRELWPDETLILTTVTETGNNTARKRIKEADIITFFPLDIGWSVRRFKGFLNPDICIIMETELWPNFLKIISENKTPVLIVNGRLSEKSYRGYKTGKIFFENVLKKISAFSMQSDSDAERIMLLGAEKEKIFVTGNLKFDQVFKSGSRMNQNIAEELMLPKGCKILVLGSTHRGEEEILISVYNKLKIKFHDLFLIVAPRHPERFREVEELLTKNSIAFCRRTEIKGNNLSGKEAILLDTIGDLPKIYSITTIVFMGGSLVPVGGHNILEPAVFKKPVLFGKYMHNFRDIAELFVKSGGGIQVFEPSEIEKEISNLLSNPKRQEEIGKKAYSLFEKNLGATERNIEIIKRFLPN
ncbi:MAG: hypothetical protein A3C43_11360 [Candidatus Schekmanbacteria bacterium RIFCSPHIGHO2_02_FULL_38_11]|uniref:3-deoxy-D-manno-octulosonic acid transferase n=1 Tax=Candidatus Schekmanbacteria bacterium RIFCSPLOWO2_12_FULL_38_15 TaxID=1817883 RepID=A0A1F7SJV1_9BACT|nr:MAG: hypothetical protein A2043_04940 [Candidatus Schekmanbacteria bacterium GWA2_38_9]OGL51720.1 MAG: hypothetical protein A3H37_11780 [Candidatus Schekmanbacteria bacterium RIFCSPLOWO2_02_FULL_38_14]OGL52387.1 MAG: hypothetical protein A3C43_11360 [Candidatus Schekmanbacteria bacterium RIFCSPHIGHO2_02_FULL_38_11]OGL54043.1 MAG: hypothetical protein A3G31_04255 [Candidatus Schekmanbacteria bacterium RIFCSPLOWO2_12_FULL_38_15]